ncbi:hypothetical protein C3F09_01155 [candidate division GN15 bacterium]|uniref:PhoD-like phosphatase metallophosphatase domain-containing protein n=1 Tax=candidate division GN15 bacterium TaxID=2072418 RepID=A0A855X4Z3_9BACT|nr:MAG: hypothetical protein C3F09_01155 [candidate division GN15 bacterium]
MPEELTLGPIVGVTANSANIWFKDVSKNMYWIRYGEKFETGSTLTFNSADDATCLCKLDNLKPNTEYDYALSKSDGGEVLANGRFATFPRDSENVAFSFGFFSCHKPEAAESLVMWDRLSRLIHSASRTDSPDSIRFNLAIGDQIYADEYGVKSKDYLNLDEASLDFHFESRYNLFWRLRSVRDVFSRCPSFMIWDDHDIRDGWGSRKNDLKDPQLLKVFRAAEESFIRHQLSHNPFCPNPRTTKYYAFRFAQAGFIVLDLRGERNANTRTMMSETQWKWLARQLNVYCGQCKVVFVVTSVPFYHPVRGFAKALVDLKKILSKDEMEDSWGSKVWQAEGARFAKILFDAQGAPGRKSKIVLLGGDAHLATCAEIRIGSDMQAISIPQFTSSAISNAAPSVYKIVHGNIQDKSWRSIYDGTQYQGRIPHLIVARNVGIVRVTPLSDGESSVRFDLHHERSEAPVTLYDNQIAKKPVVIA